MKARNVPGFATNFADYKDEAQGLQAGGDRQSSVPRGLSPTRSREMNAVNENMESISSTFHESNALKWEQWEADKLFKRDYLASTKQVNDAKEKKALAEERNARMDEWKSLKAMLQEWKDVIPAHEYEPLERRADDLFQSLFGRYSS